MAETLRRWSPRLVNLLLLAGIGWLVYQLALPWLPFAKQEPTESAPVTAPIVAPKKPADIPDQQVADWHLFGESAGSESAAPVPTDAPETKLDLSLKGIVATDDKTDGYAIIQKPDQEEQHFKVNDSVFGLATLEEIYVDRVILLHNGRYETLRLPIEFMASDLVLERARKEEAKRIVTDFRQKLINRDGMELIKMFGFEETYGNGGFIGFTVKIVGEDGARMLEVLGVEEGDVITAVNGKRFAESIEAVESLKDLRTATEVDVEIERNGVPLFFHFDFDDLGQTAGTEEAAVKSIKDRIPESEDTDAARKHGKGAL